MKYFVCPACGSQNVLVSFSFRGNIVTQICGDCGKYTAEVYTQDCLELILKQGQKVQALYKQKEGAGGIHENTKSFNRL